MRLDHLIRLSRQDWAIHPPVMDGWCGILDSKLAGNPIPQDLVSVGRSRPRAEDELFIRDGNVAIVPLVGTLVKTNTPFTCDATYGEIRQAVTAAEQAKGIDAILIDGDTPGGTVAGVQETGDFLRKVNQRKPLYGWVDDLAASAGYWLLAQTQMIAAHAAADIGSIGVLTVHYDRSGRDKLSGVRRSILAVGDYKAVGNDTAPLSDDARSYIMERLNQTYDLFITAVTRSRRNLSVQSIRALQGRVYKSGEAKKLGLIDHVMGREDYIDYIKKQVRGSVSVPAAAAMTSHHLSSGDPHPAAPLSKGADKMITDLIHNKPEVSAAQIEEAAAMRERKRIMAVVAKAVGPEIANKISIAVDSGLQPEQLAALGVQFNANSGADMESRERILQAIINAAPSGLRAVSEGNEKPEGKINTEGIYASRAAIAGRLSEQGTTPIPPFG